MFPTRQLEREKKKEQQTSAKTGCLLLCRAVGWTASVTFQNGHGPGRNFRPFSRRQFQKRSGRRKKNIISSTLAAIPLSLFGQFLRTDDDKWENFLMMIQQQRQGLLVKDEKVFSFFCCFYFRLLFCHFPLFLTNKWKRESVAAVESRHVFDPHNITREHFQRWIATSRTVEVVGNIPSSGVEIELLPRHPIRDGQQLTSDHSVRKKRGRKYAKTSSNCIWTPIGRKRGSSP